MEFKKYNHSKKKKKSQIFGLRKVVLNQKKENLIKNFLVVIPPPNVTGRFIWVML